MVFSCLAYTLIVVSVVFLFLCFVVCFDFSYLCSLTGWILVVCMGTTLFAVCFTFLFCVVYYHLLCAGSCRRFGILFSCFLCFYLLLDVWCFACCCGCLFDLLGLFGGFVVWFGLLLSCVAVGLIWFIVLSSISLYCI